ncbi:MAG: hypothetical protein ACLFQB_01175 [Chitinispirillaceae bacterium]
MYMKRDKQHTEIHRLCRMLLLILCTSAVSYSAVTKITDFEFKAEQRGLVLIVTGDGAVRADVSEEKKNGGKYTGLNVSIKGAESALGANSFKGPEKLPVKTVSVKKKGDAVELSIEMDSPVSGPVQVRSGGNQLKIMLTKDAQPRLSWKASEVKVEQVAEKKSASTGKNEISAPAKKSQKAQITSDDKKDEDSQVVNVTIPSEAEAELQNMRVIQRDRTAALYFDFSSAPIVQFKNQGRSIDITFINATRSMKKSVFTIPGNTVFRSVKFSNKKNKDGRREISAEVKLRGSLSGNPFGSKQGKEYAVYIPTQDSARVFLWSADKGERASHSFARIGSEPLDLKQMKKRATRDTERSLNKTDLFPLKEETVSKDEESKVVSSDKNTEKKKVQDSKASEPAQKSAQKKPSAMQTSIPSSRKPPEKAKKPPESTVPEKKKADKPDPSITIEVPSGKRDVELEKNKSASEGKEVVKKSPEGEMVKYRIYGRDPFVPLQKDTSGSELPDVESLALVGVLEDSQERIALLEDASDHNRAYALRKNDRVESGRVLRIYRDKVVFLIRDFNVSRSYTLSLTKPDASKARDR